MEFLNWFINPVKNKYADFSGRASRKEFWMFVLIYVIIYVILMAINELLGLIYSLALLVPAIAITTRRLHDTGMSGWWQLLGVIPVVGWLVVIILTVRPGQVGVNEYGQNPNGSGSTDAGAQSNGSESTQSSSAPSEPVSQPVTQVERSSSNDNKSQVDQ